MCVCAHTCVIIQSDYVTVQLQKFPQRAAAFPFLDLSRTCKEGSDGVSPCMNNVFVHGVSWRLIMSYGVSWCLRLSHVATMHDEPSIFNFLHISMETCWCKKFPALLLQIVKTSEVLEP